MRLDKYLKVSRIIKRRPVAIETARWNREDFIGVLDDKFLPEWAKPKLAELNAQEQTNAPTMGGMNMK